jgi:hypothetical protein
VATAPGWSTAVPGVPSAAQMMRGANESSSSSSAAAVIALSGLASSTAVDLQADISPGRGVATRTTAVSLQTWNAIPVSVANASSSGVALVLPLTDPTSVGEDVAGSGVINDPLGRFVPTGARNDSSPPPTVVFVCPTQVRRPEAAALSLL